MASDPVIVLLAHRNSVHALEQQQLCMKIIILESIILSEETEM